jgi:glycosyltransferase involved in cell wall biosynthesis
MYQCAPGIESSRLRPLMPQLLLRAAFKARVPRSTLTRLLERKFLNNLDANDVAYLWPGVSTALHHELRRRQIPIVREQINTQAVTYRRCLQNAYDALGWPVPPGSVPTDSMVEREREELTLVDFVFAPSDSVAASLQESGVHESRIIPTSYGWSADDVRLNQNVTPGMRDPHRPVTFMFSAMGSVRKGLPWLLQAWKQASLSSAKLLIFGSLDSDVSQHCANLLAMSNVQVRGFVRDLRDWYARSDVFVLPSHEEGSPMVSYAAAAAGLAMIVSPMGGGGFLRPGVDAMVLDPFDIASWADAFRLLHNDVQKREALQEAARIRALDFTWTLSAQRRSEALISRLHP